MGVLGGSAAVGALGSENAVAGSQATSTRRGDGVRLLNVGSPGDDFAHGESTSVTVDGDTVATGLRFGELSDPVDLAPGKRTISVSADESSVTERVAVTPGTAIVALAGGTRTRAPELVALSFDDLFEGGAGVVSFVNLTDRDSVTVDIGSSPVEIAHGGTAEPHPPTARAIEFDVQTPDRARSWHFDRLATGDRSAAVVIAGCTSDAGIPFGIKTVYGAK